MKPLSLLVRALYSSYRFEQMLLIYFEGEKKERKGKRKKKEKSLSFGYSEVNLSLIWDGFSGLGYVSSLLNTG